MSDRDELAHRRQKFDLGQIVLLASGELTELPDDIVAYLQTRRQQASKLGKWVEGHYHPGKRHTR
jgi:hypothetical protein